MRRVFVDTSYWVVVIDARDPWHGAARRAPQKLGRARYITTDTVILETLNAFSACGATMRLHAIASMRALLADRSVEVVEQNRDLLLRGMDLYEKRPDKGYSLTDCISLVVLRDRSLRDVLTTDHHFAQEGFTVLIEA